MAYAFLMSLNASRRQSEGSWPGARDWGGKEQPLLVVDEYRVANGRTSGPSVRHNGERSRGADVYGLSQQRESSRQPIVYTTCRTCRINPASERSSAI